MKRYNDFKLLHRFFLEHKMDTTTLPALTEAQWKEQLILAAAWQLEIESMPDSVSMALSEEEEKAIKDELQKEAELNIYYSCGGGQL